MSKIKYYSDVKIIKKSIKKRFKRGLNFFLIIAIFTATIFASIMLSKAISVGGIGAMVVYGSGEINIKAHKLYAVILGEYDTIEEAEKVSLGSNIQGASGYIWQDNKYMVIGNIYQNITDAEKVLSNLNDSNYKPIIYTISFPQLKLYLSDYAGSDVKKIENILSYIDKLIDSLYDYSISYDKGEINNFAISSQISELRGECKTYISQLQSILNVENEKIEKIQRSIILMDETLNDAILKTIDNSTTSYIIKYTHSKIVNLKYELYNQL